MIKSLASKQKDVVCIIPKKSLTASELEADFLSVLTSISTIFDVKAVSVDNSAVNRSFYTRLCDGNLRPKIRHPCNPEENLWLLFDYVHNMKNIYNNWLSRRRFTFPTISFNVHERMEPIPHIQADFSHIEQLFAKEESKPLKIAHKITKTSLAPSNIQKTCTKHALSVFNESTVAALRFYARPHWNETADFIDFVVKLWKILNVRTTHKGVHHRDDYEYPVRHGDDWKLQVLSDAAKFFDSWHNQQSNLKLAHQTSMACQQTFKGIVGLTQHLLEEKGFQYVLLGFFNSDPLEGRFGWWRQLSGANFYISVRQVLENEKKVRSLSLLQSNLLKDIILNDSGASASVVTDESHGDMILQNAPPLNMRCLDDMDAGDLNSVLYVAGYIGRSIARERKCDKCKLLLVSEHCGSCY